MIQCDNGHFYDENRFASCPYCQGGGAAGAVGKTVAAGMAQPGGIGKTIAVKPAGDSGNDRGKTVAVIQKKTGVDPVVGFLIITEGNQKGAFFRLSAGRNFIGRSTSMEIPLTDDDTVSREGHAIVTYDAKHNAFSLAPGQGRGITYLNDQLVENAQNLAAYDVIEVGSTKLTFLPFCGERFSWEETEDA